MNYDAMNDAECCAVGYHRRKDEDPCACGYKPGMPRNENRAWKETWEVQRYVVEMAGDAGRQLGSFVDDADEPDWPSCDRDRAQLAATAPEMARLLIEIRGAELVPGGMEDRIRAVLRKAGVPDHT